MAFVHRNFFSCRWKEVPCGGQNKGNHPWTLLKYWMSPSCFLLCQQPRPEYVGQSDPDHCKEQSALRGVHSFSQRGNLTLWNRFQIDFLFYMPVTGAATNDFQQWLQPCARSKFLPFSYPENLGTGGLSDVILNWIHNPEMAHHVHTHTPHLWLGTACVLRLF